MGKNHKIFLRKSKQIRVKLHGNKWKTFLARRKRRELDRKMKRKTGHWQQLEYCIILVMMEDAYSVSHCRWGYPNLKSASELQKLFEVMVLVIVKSTSTFTACINVTWHGNSASVMFHKYSFRACIYTKQTRGRR